MAYEPPQRDAHPYDGASPGQRLRRRIGDSDLLRGLSVLLQHGRALWALAILAMVLDMVLTGIGLSMGLQERNPVALAFIEQYGLFTAGVILKGSTALFGYLCWRFYPGIHRGVIPLGLALPSWGAVAINTVTIYSIL
jgi:hypothetical protein